MKRYSTVDLRHLEIINLCDGARLGYATDFEFDKDDAQILSLIIGGCNGFLGLGKEDDLIILRGKKSNASEKIPSWSE